MNIVAHFDTESMEWLKNYWYRMTKVLLGIDGNVSKDELLKAALGTDFKRFVEIEVSKTLINLVANASETRLNNLKLIFDESWVTVDPTNPNNTKYHDLTIPLKEMLNQGIGSRTKWVLGTAFENYGRHNGDRCECQDRPRLN